jgi:hypothetical protein
MLTRQPLDMLPLWATYFLTALVLFLALEAGFQLGRAKQKRWPDQAESGVSATVGASLAFLGFLLAFVTSIALGLFNERRQLVIAEANAIGTAFLRAGFLATPYGPESRQLLREYLDLRLAALDPAQRAAAIARSEEIHGELWRRAESAAGQEPTPIVGLYVSALNEVIDLHTERLNAELGIRVPPSLVLGLYGVAVLTMMLVGVHNGYRERRNLIALTVMVLILALVFLLILELDRSQQGVIQVPQKALIDLQQSLKTMP